MKTNKGWGVALVLGLLLSTLPPYPLAAEDAYEQGRAALDQKQWERAESLFREAAKSGGDKADDAMYWRAYALGKLGRVDQALRALDELKRTHPDSPWIDDAQELREELRGDKEVDEDDGDLKSMALMALVQADPERALPHLEKYLKSDRPTSDKQQALFMLLQSGSPRATKIVVDIAKDPKADPELREAAVSSLGVAGGNGTLLNEIYRSTLDSQVKEAVLNAYLVSGNDDALLDVARNDKDADLREKAIQLLGAMGARDALDKLGSEAKDSKSREALLNAYMVSGNTAKLLEIARTDRDQDVREKAIQLLGAAGGVEELEELYKSERSVELRGTILNGFMVAGHAAPLLRAAREATEPELRQKAIQLLGAMSADEELWKLYESEHSVEVKKEILQAQAVGGGGDKLMRVAKSDPEPELRMAAIQGLGIAGHVSTSEMIELYRQDKAFDVKRAVLQALFTRGNVKALVQIARKEPDPKLKREAVQLIAVSGKEEGTAYMLELLDEKEPK